MTDIREAPRELVALALGIRPDWDRDETWTAILACKTAGRDWKLIVTRLVAIAFRDDTPPSRPRELWDDIRGVLDRPAQTGRLDPRAKAEALAACEADAIRRRATGPMGALRDTGPMEWLREGPDP